MKIKVEPNNNDHMQSLIETDENLSSEDEAKSASQRIRNSKKKEKKKRRKESEEDEESSRKAKRSKVETAPVPSSSGSRIPERSESSVSNSNPENGEVGELKKLLNNLSCEKKDPETVRQKLESFLGKDVLTALSSILVPSTPTKAIEEPTSMPEEEEKVHESSNNTESLRSEHSGSESEKSLCQGKKETEEKSKAKTKKRKPRVRKNELDKLNEDIAKSFICNEVVKATGPRLKTRKMYAEDDLIQDELYDNDTGCSDFSKPEESEEIVTGSLAESTQAEEADTSVDSIPDEPISLRECTVRLVKLDLAGLEMPATILPDGSISRLPLSEPQVTTIVPALEPFSDMFQVSTIIPSDSSPAEQEVIDCEQMEIITIDDDDDDDVEIIPPEVLRSLKKEIKLETNSSPISKVVAQTVKQVFNLSYVQCRSGLKLKCCVGKCTYECNYGFDEQRFTYHIQTQHIFIKWCGSCKICDSSVHSDFGSLLDEYNHMKKKHIERDTGETQRTPPSPKSKRESKKKRRKDKSKSAKQLEEKKSKSAKQLEERAPSKPRIVRESPLKMVIQRQSPSKASTKLLLPNSINGHASTSNERTEAPNGPAKTVPPLCIKSSTKSSTETSGKNVLQYTIVKASVQVPPIHRQPSVKASQVIPQPPVALPPISHQMQPSIHPPPVQASSISRQTPVQPCLKFINLPGDKLSSRKVGNNVIPISDLSPSKIPASIVVSSSPTIQIVNGQVSIPLRIVKVPPTSSSVAQQPAATHTSKSPNQFVDSETMNNPKDPSGPTVPSSIQKDAPAKSSSEELHPKLLANTATSLSGQRRLRPWLQADDMKHTHIISRMLSPGCLRDRYKCMGSVCNFHSDDGAVFCSHLKWHEAYQSSDFKNFRRCCYCVFTANGSEDLAKHVQETHGRDMYACTKCFYRSINEHFVFKHLSSFHKDESMIILACGNNQAPVDMRSAVDEVKQNRIKYIQPISCAGELLSCEVFENIQLMRNFLYLIRLQSKVLQLQLIF